MEYDGRTVRAMAGSSWICCYESAIEMVIACAVFEVSDSPWSVGPCGSIMVLGKRPSSRITRCDRGRWTDLVNPR